MMGATRERKTALGLVLRLAFLVAGVLTTAAAGMASAEKGGADSSSGPVPPPRVLVLDGPALATARARAAAGDKEYADAVADLRRDADKALKAGPFSVVDKKETPPSGDKHDYRSVGPYWWADPSKPDGKPHIRRDGEVNADQKALEGWFREYLKWLRESKNGKEEEEKAGNNHGTWYDAQAAGDLAGGRKPGWREVLLRPARTIDKGGGP
jgi:hypothetical protein